MIHIVETAAWLIGLVVLVAIAAVLVALNEAERPYRPHRVGRAHDHDRALSPAAPEDATEASG